MFFNAILIVGWWLSFRALTQLFVVLPFPGWLGWPVCGLLSIVHGLIIMSLVGKMLQHGPKWQRSQAEHDIKVWATIWLVSAAACVAACLTYLALAPLRLPIPAEQCLVGAAGFGLWGLIMHKWTKKAEADSLTAAQPPNPDD